VPVAIHAITDGRDVAPTSAAGSWRAAGQPARAGARIGTVIGRYWAMDRDNRWDRVERAYRRHGARRGRARRARMPLRPSRRHARGETDEFIAPTVIADYAGREGRRRVLLPELPRRPRARDPGGPGRSLVQRLRHRARPDWAMLLGMVEYSDAHNAFMHTAFPKRVIVNTLGAWVARTACASSAWPRPRNTPMSPSS
jgi:2,3-bisphosphoglycerate-independent phosphoglycerate mutase